MRMQHVQDEQTPITSPHAEHGDSAAVTQPVQQGPPSVPAQIGRFVWHFVQMCIVCCVGGVTLSLLFFGGAALIGYPNLIQRAPELSTLLVAFAVALPMAGWMRFRGMEWRPTLEMSGTTMATGILLVGLGRLGAIPSGGEIEWLTALACPIMLIPMLFRLDLYTGHSGHHMHGA